MIEREVKLLVDRGDEVPPLDELLAGLGAWVVEPLDQDAVYYDTLDLRLTRAGVSVRHRSDEGWTVKTPVDGNGSSLVREEIRVGGPSGDPPAGVRELVLAWARAAPLVEVAHVRTHRRRITVLDDRRVPVVEVADDQVVAHTGDATPLTFHEVEIETKGEGADTLVDELVARLRAAGAHDGGGLAKVARALGPPAAVPPDVPEPRPAERGATVEAMVAGAVGASVRRLVDHDHVVRRGEDPEGVHQARVAARRLRSDLRTFRSVLDRDWSEPLRVELRWLGGLLGQVRDADVMLERLRAEGDALGLDRAALAALVDQVRTERAIARAVLLEAMSSARYIALLDALVDAAAHPRVRRRSRRRAAELMPRFVRKPWRRIRKTVRALPAEPSDAELHEVRKRAKNVRYALEAVSPVSGRRATRAASRLADLQDMLGEQHDAVTLVAWLETNARASADVSVAFAAGELAATIAARGPESRAGWRHAWRRARRAVRRFSG